MIFTCHKAGVKKKKTPQPSRRHTTILRQLVELIPPYLVPKLARAPASLGAPVRCVVSPSSCSPGSSFHKEANRAVADTAKWDFAETAWCAEGFGLTPGELTPLLPFRSEARSKQQSPQQRHIYASWTTRMTCGPLVRTMEAVWIDETPTPLNPIVRKVSNFKSVGFRPGQLLRVELEMLSEELSQPDCKFTISQILREGVTVFWPHIRAYMRARAMRGGSPAKVVAHIVAASIKAHQLGLEPNEIDQALSQALNEKQGAQPCILAEIGDSFEWRSMNP